MRLAAAVLAALSLAACSVQAASTRETPAAMAPSEYSFAPLATHRYVQTGTIAPEGQVPQAFGTGPQLYWIRSEAGFAKMGYVKADAPKTGLDAAHGGPGKAAAPGDPDFGKQDVVLITMGVQGTTGYALELESVKRSGRELRFSAQTRSPTPGAMVGEALTHPSEWVVVDKLPRDSRPVLIFDGKAVKFDLHILD